MKENVAHWLATGEARRRGLAYAEGHHLTARGCMSRPAVGLLLLLLGEGGEGGGVCDDWRTGETWASRCVPGNMDPSTRAPLATPVAVAPAVMSAAATREHLHLDDWACLPPSPWC